MPKIIENIREKLLGEARRQVMEQGYSAMTIRSVARACGVGVGTVYNYFTSKDMLVASFMLADWQECMVRIRQSCRVCAEAGKDLDVPVGRSVCGSNEVDIALRRIYDELRCFTEKYRALFQDESAGTTFATAFPQRHKQLRSQLAEPIQLFCQVQSRVSPDFLAEFIAENMLTWTLNGCTYEEIGNILLQLF